jgi:hypothetical protein
MHKERDHENLVERSLYQSVQDLAETEIRIPKESRIVLTGTNNPYIGKAEVPQGMIKEVETDHLRALQGDWRGEEKAYLNVSAADLADYIADLDRVEGYLEQGGTLEITLESGSAEAGVRSGTDTVIRAHSDSREHLRKGLIDGNPLVADDGTCIRYEEVEVMDAADEDAEELVRETVEEEYSSEERDMKVVEAKAYNRPEQIADEEIQFDSVNVTVYGLESRSDELNPDEVEETSDGHMQELFMQRYRKNSEGDEDHVALREMLAQRVDQEPRLYAEVVDYLEDEDKWLVVEVETDKRDVESGIYGPHDADIRIESSNPHSTLQGALDRLVEEGEWGDEELKALDDVERDGRGHASYRRRD